MRIIHREMIGSEDRDLRLIAETDLSDSEMNLLNEILETWPAQHVKATGFDKWEKSPRLELMNADNRKVIDLVGRWFPEEWDWPFAQYLEKMIPAITLIEVGRDFEPPYRCDNEFIDVPAKKVRFEDGTYDFMQGCSIAKYPVSVAQYQRFVKKTGYVTVAEASGDDYSFRDNPRLYEIPDLKRLPMPVYWVSYVDAQAYCDWAKVRLPSETEWLAAWVIDDNVYDDNIHSNRVEELKKSPNALKFVGSEITGTVLRDHILQKRSGMVKVDCVVVRNDPFYARSTYDVSGPNRKYNRSYVGLRAIELWSFRVCKF